MHFVRPFPPGPPKVLPPLRLLRFAQENLVAIWPIDTFSRDVFGHPKSVFRCNGQATVKTGVRRRCGEFPLQIAAAASRAEAPDRRQAVHQRLPSMAQTTRPRCTADPSLPPAGAVAGNDYGDRREGGT